MNNINSIIKLPTIYEEIEPEENLNNDLNKKAEMGKSNEYVNTEWNNIHFGD